MFPHPSPLGCVSEAADWEVRGQTASRLSWMFILPVVSHYQAGWPYRDVSSEMWFFSLKWLKWSIQTVISFLDGNWSLTRAGECWTVARRSVCQKSNMSHLSDLHQQDELQTYQTGSLYETDPGSADMKPNPCVCLHQLIQSETPTLTISQIRHYQCEQNWSGSFYL